MKIAIIKLGALGDVVRTLSILPAIKNKYPESEITWITKKSSSDLFRNNPYVNKVFSIPYDSKEEFDVLYNFDFDEDATSLAKKISSKVKYGFSSEGGFPCAFNLGAEYYLNTMFDDELKKNNKKTYQEMMFEASELEYKHEMPELFLDKAEIIFAEEFIKKNKLNTNKLIGIHLGAGNRWPSKEWHESRVLEFIEKAKNKSYDIILFSGPDDIERNKGIIKKLSSKNINIPHADTSKSMREFIAIASKCSKMICSESFALHISLALKKPTICLFFCTSPSEIEGYGLLKKIISPMLYDFFPERMDEYNENLVKSISADEVLSALQK